jgi:hypothetical protein
MPRGGDRSAQVKAAGKKVGRPAKAKLAFSTEKSIAVRVLHSIDEEFYWLFLLHWDEVKAAAEKIKENPKDEFKIMAALREVLTKSDREQIATQLQRLTDRREGKAPERIDTAFNPETPLRIIIDHIGRPKDQVAAQAVIARGPVE